MVDAAADIRAIIVEELESAGYDTPDLEMGDRGNAAFSRLSNRGS